MLQYLIILLDDTSTSYCHYENNRHKSKLMPLETLKQGIRFAMMENLMIQFIYPDYELPQEYKEAIETIDHSKIVSSLCEDVLLQKQAEVVVFNDWTGFDNYPFNTQQAYVLRTTKEDLFDKYTFLNNILGQITRLNIVISDVETFSEDDFKTYRKLLSVLSCQIEQLYVNGKSPQLNILTDRMMLSEMNNCGGGDTNITLAPNGMFYICPAFYYEKEADCVGDLQLGVDIKNKQLYRFNHAPICRHCDAYQCKRCIWFNRKTTLEVNTPSHEQCVIAHLERNTSRELLENIRKHGSFLQDTDIKEIKYLDPYENRDEWNN